MNKKYLQENNLMQMHKQFMRLCEYVSAVPLTEEGEEDEGEVVILKLEDTEEDAEEESYVGVEDEEILNKVFAIFKEKYKDEFNFVDED